MESEVKNPIPRVVDPSQKVSVKEKLFFGAADIYGGGAQGLVATVYMVFLINNGISLGRAGIILLLAKLWDAVTDPLMGIISDNTRTRWGRRRPYIFAGGLLTIISFALLFMPLYGMQNDTWKFLLYLFGFLFFDTISTVINVPYSSMSTEISTDFHEKTSVNSIRLIFSMVSSGISALVPIVTVERLQNGYMTVNQFSLLMILVFGIFYTVPLLLTSLFTKERAPIPLTRNRFNIRDFVKPLKVKAFVFFLFSYMLAFSCMDLITTNLVYFADYGLNLGMSSSIMLIVIMLSYAAMVPVLYKLMAKGWAKPALFRIGIPLYVLGIVCLCLYPSGRSTWPVLVFCVIVGIGMSGCQTMPWILFPDVVQVGDLKMGASNTGSYSGLMTFIRKTASAVAIWLSATILGLPAVGFKAPVTDYATGIVTKFPQTESAVLGLRLIILIPVVIFITLAFICSRKVKLTHARSIKIKELLDMRANGVKIPEGLTGENLEFYEKVKKELF